MEKQWYKREMSANEPYLESLSMHRLANNLVLAPSRAHDRFSEIVISFLQPAADHWCR